MSEPHFGGNTLPEITKEEHVHDLGAKRVFNAALLTNIDYSGGTNPIYVGQATPGTATSTAGWSIKKITYDANNNPTAIQWGGGLPSFAQTWDNRASLSYS